MSEYRELTVEALNRLRINSSSSYSWFGAPSPPLGRKIASAMGRELTREFLIFQIQQELYDNFYCRGFATPAAHRSPPSTRRHAASFRAFLSGSNHGTGTCQTGWEILTKGDQQTVVHRDGLSLWVKSAETVGEKPAGKVSVLLPCELLRTVPGFYLALGETASSAMPVEPLLHLYWHLTSAAAPTLLDHLSSSLNALQIPFQLQVVDDPARYNRCDAGELKLPLQHYQTASESIHGVYESLRNQLHDMTPAFTKRLGPGLGLAEDPGDGQSFGRHRIALIAEAAVRAYESGKQSTHTRTSVIEEVLDEHGLDLDHPYLNPGSVDDYQLVGSL